MSEIRNICVYCGSANGTDPIFLNAAQELGRSIAEHGLGLVYGGGDNGLMGAVARSVLEHGGHVTGVIPGFLRQREAMLEKLALTTQALTGRIDEQLALIAGKYF